MTREEAWDWISERELRDPQWAHHEEDVRRMAVEAQQRLYGPDSQHRVAFVVLAKPDRQGRLGRGFKEVVLHRHMLPRVGGLEELLLFEEIIRRELSAL